MVLTVLNRAEERTLLPIRSEEMTSFVWWLGVRDLSYCRCSFHSPPLFFIYLFNNEKVGGLVGGNWTVSSLLIKESLSVLFPISFLSFRINKLTDQLQSWSILNQHPAERIYYRNKKNPAQNKPTHIKERNTTCVHTKNESMGLRLLSHLDWWQGITQECAGRGPRIRLLSSTVVSSFDF